jgi:hypothetical protein
MNVERALKIIPEEAVLSAESVPNYFGGAWVVWAYWLDYERDPDEPARLYSTAIKRPVTQFAEPFSAARWLAEYNRARPDTGRRKHRLPTPKGNA